MRKCWSIIALVDLNKSIGGTNANYPVITVRSMGSVENLEACNCLVCALDVPQESHILFLSDEGPPTSPRRTLSSSPVYVCSHLFYSLIVICSIFFCTCPPHLAYIVHGGVHGCSRLPARGRKLAEHRRKPSGLHRHSFRRYRYVLSYQHLYYTHMKCIRFSICLYIDTPASMLPLPYSLVLLPSRLAPSSSARRRSPPRLPSPPPRGPPRAPPHHPRPCIPGRGCLSRSRYGAPPPPTTPIPPLRPDPPRRHARERRRPPRMVTAPHGACCRGPGWWWTRC